MISVDLIELSIEKFQIFITYNATFYDLPKHDRQRMSRLGFNFVCDCDACTADWPTIAELGAMVKVMYDFLRRQFRDQAIDKSATVPNYLFISDVACMNSYLHCKIA